MKKSFKNIIEEKLISSLSILSCNTNSIINCTTIKIIAIITAVLLLMGSCKKENTQEPVSQFENAVFVVNEGNFTAGNASLTYYNQLTEEASQQVFYRQNDAPLGDVANSIFIGSSYIYITVNNSHTIYKIDSKTGTYQDKANELTSPRNFIKIDDKRALISDLYENNLTLINTDDMSIISKINVGRTSENLLKKNDEVFITNWSAFNQEAENNMLMILNTQTMQLTDSLTIGKEPNSMVIDKNDNIWVLCSGGFMNNEKPSLWKINSTSHEILKKIEFNDIETSPTNLAVNPSGDSLCFINTNVYSISISDDNISEEPIISSGGNFNFYSLAISPENQIYVSDANDYNKSGMVYRYSTNGKLLGSFRAGIIPGDIAFMN